MNVTRKDATITNTDDAFPGSFEVVLSAPTLDRDGDTLLPEEWKQPLPGHITFDSDHGMSVATTVGSGVPSIDESGNLVVSGTYSSLPRAQEVRTLVNEGHIRTTSVAFMTEKSTKAGAVKATRELLNGAFVAIPSNREALVLSSKSAAPTPADVFGKAGARNSATDQAHMQAAHDSLVAAGAVCGPSDDTGAVEYATGGKAAADRAEVKAIAGSLEATQERVRDALQDAYAGTGTPWPCLRATLPDEVVFDLYGDDGESGTYRQPYTDDGSVVTLTGEPARTDVMEILTPDADAARDEAADEAAAAADDSAAAAAKSAAAADGLEMQFRALRALTGISIE